VLGVPERVDVPGLELGGMDPSAKFRQCTRSAGNIRDYLKAKESTGTLRWLPKALPSKSLFRREMQP